MTKNLYIIIVVLLRLAGLWYVVGSATTLLFVNLLGGSFGRPNAGLALVPTLLPLLGGIVLWICAKPVANVVTADLE